MSKENQITFEFIKESELTKSGINTVYYTRRGKDFCKGSLSYDKEEAYAFFKTLLKLHGETQSIEVLETAIIEKV